jgi:hypothetical protein
LESQASYEDFCNPSVIGGVFVIPEESLACGRAGLLKFKLSLRIKKDSSRMTPPVTEALLRNSNPS